MWFEPEYNQIHLEPEQQKRQLSATKIPIKNINKDTQTANINDYDVSLRDCTCRDFKTRTKPCKHMYRLAYELGYLTPPVKIKEDSSYKGHREKTVKANVSKSIKSIIDTVPARAQLLLLAYLKGFCTEAPTKESKKMAALLEDKGLLTKYDPPAPDIDVLCSALTTKQLKALCPIIPNSVTKRTDIIQFISNESIYVEVLKKIYEDDFNSSGLHYSDYYWPSELEPYITSITRFLKQKNYTQEDFDALNISEATIMF